jgi:uncharacterized membrane protein YdjX (TVP38/TMEM64 family)
VTGPPSDDDQLAVVLPNGGGAAENVTLVRYWLLGGVVLGVFGLTFVIVEALAVPLLDDPVLLLSGGGVVAAVGGFGLLAADVVLPVPSSLVMISHGVLFGAVAGGALSLLGGVSAALAGYGLGRWAGPPALRRVCSAAERERATRMVRRWGTFAVVVTRPVPLLAETVAVMAGAERLGWLRTTIASAVGVLPAAVLYAAVGALGWSGRAGPIAFGLVLLVAAVMWSVGRVRAGDRGPVGGAADSDAARTPRAGCTGFSTKSSVRRRQ